MVADTKQTATQEKTAASPKRVAKTAAVEETTTAVTEPPADKAAASGASVVEETAGKTAGEETQAVVAKKPATPKKSASARKKKPVAPAELAVEKDTETPAKAISPYQEEAGEEYMNSKQSQHFRKLLINWKQTLMEEVERTVHHMQDEASNFPDPNDRATQEEEFALELRTRDRERKLIKKINESLITLETGDYGYCEVCGVEIGVKRLEARPTATLCIDCKTIDEIKERQRA